MRITVKIRCTCGKAPFWTGERRTRAGVAAVHCEAPTCCMSGQTKHLLTNEIEFRVIGVRGTRTAKSLILRLAWVRFCGLRAAEQPQKRLFQKCHTISSPVKPDHTDIVSDRIFVFWSIVRREVLHVWSQGENIVRSGLLFSSFSPFSGVFECLIARQRLRFSRAR